MAMIQYCKEKKDIFVGFLDYEKAFDFVNRAGVIEKLMYQGCGKSFVQAVANTYEQSLSSQNIQVNQLGSYITRQHGLTLGKKSSTNLFSFYLSDVAISLQQTDNEDFFDPSNLLQLADDTTVIAETFVSSCNEYSKQIYQIPNFKKTVYAHFSPNLVTTPMIIPDYKPILSIEKRKGHSYLGMIFVPTADPNEIITFNFRGGGGGGGLI